MRTILALVTLFSYVFAQPASGQEYVVVTGTRAEQELPGVTLRRTGDFLLLAVRVENDSREEALRVEEMSATLDNMLDRASEVPDIELGIVLDDNLLRPLVRGDYRPYIRAGSRPDTSVIYVRVKTPIPEEDADALALANQLAAFIDDVEVQGRTELISSTGVEVSIVDPQQYRGALIELITDEINQITRNLGGDYAVVLDGMDQKITWTRMSDTELALYIPYDFVVLPKSLSFFTQEF